MASVIRSVEKVTLTLASGTNPASANLTKGQDQQACVPFFSIREAGAAVTDSFSNRLTEVWFDDNAGTARVNAQLNAGDDIQVEIFVVEWDLSKVKVQQGTVTVVTGATATAAIAAVDQAKAFIVFNLRGTSVLGDGYGVNAFDAAFSSDTEITFTRLFSTTSSLTGRYYVVECIGSEFSVQVASPALATSGTTGDDTISSVDTAKTFLVGGCQTGEAADDARDGAAWFHLESATAVRLARSGGGTPAAVCTATVFAVTCVNDEWTVQRAQPTISAAETADDTTITGIDQTRAIVNSGTGMGHSMPHMNSTTGASTGLIGLTFQADTTVRASRRATSTAGYYAFEVIQFAEPSAGTAHNVAASLTGQGSLAGAPARQLAAAAVLSGRSSLAAAASAARSTAAGLAGHGTLVAGAELSVAPLDVAATLTGRATLLAGASAYRGASVALSAACTLIAGASALRTGAAVFSGMGLLALAPTAARNVSATLAGTATLTAAAETPGQIEIAATLTAGSALFAAPAALRRATVALTGSAAMTAGASVARPVAASLAGQATLEASPEVARNAAAVLSGASTLTAGAEIAQAAVDIAATLTGQASLSAFARLVLNASIRLDGGSSFAATALDVAGNPTRLRSRRPRTALDTALPQAVLATRVRQAQQSRAPARALRSRAPDNEQLS